MLYTDMVKYECCYKDKKCRDNKAKQRKFVDRIEEIREIIDVQILGGIDIRHQESGSPDNDCKDEQEQYSLIKCE